MIRWALAFLIAGTLSAQADDPHGHAQYHEEFYRHLKQPGSGMSCCDNKDCRPSDHRVQSDGTIQFNIAGRWLTVPRSLTLEVLTPDGQGHWCGVHETTSPITFCAILPRSGS